ncbi:MAG TPA: hypothetical protein VFZ31_16920, partial [Vicinamibacterales bacterium]
VLLTVLCSNCSVLPANRECAYVNAQLGGIVQMKSAHIECGSGLFANDGVSARVEMTDGSVLRFERLGFNAFSSNATNIVLSEASGLMPRVASCDGVAPPNFHRDAALGPHLRPTLIDAKEAVSRYRELQEEVEYWPQCPQYYEVENRRGARFHYCAKKPGAPEEPPRPGNCESAR